LDDRRDDSKRTRVSAVDEALSLILGL
jgi:hypothetical protein